MKSSNIPDSVVLRGSLWPGTYTKRSGSRTDKTLFCWFNDENAKVPHISVHIQNPQSNFEHFHVTFPVLREVADPKANWRSRDTIVTTDRYHVYLQIDQRDKCVITDSDATMNWRRPQVQQINLSFAGMQDKGRDFGDWFYAAALFQSVGG